MASEGPPEKITDEVPLPPLPPPPSSRYCRTVDDLPLNFPPFIFAFTRCAPPLPPNILDDLLGEPIFGGAGNCVIGKNSSVNGRPPLFVLDGQGMSLAPLEMLVLPPRPPPPPPPPPPPRPPILPPTTPMLPPMLPPK